MNEIQIKALAILLEIRIEQLACVSWNISGETKSVIMDEISFLEFLVKKLEEK